MSRENRTIDQIAKEFLDQHEIRDRAIATRKAAHIEEAKAEATLAMLESDLAEIYSGAKRDVVIVYNHETILVPVFGKPKIIDRICVRL